MITKEQLKESVPSYAKGLITDKVVETMNQLEGEHGQDFAEQFKQNMVNMHSILKSGKYSVDDYLNAVKFVSFQLLKNTDIDSYMMTFPDRYDRIMEKWRAKGLDEEEIRGKKISPFVSAYKTNDIVVKVMEHVLVPPSILNAPLFQEALNVQAQLMYTARSEMVRSQAAESVLKYTKMNEAAKVEMEVKHSGSDEINALMNTMNKLAKEQQKVIVEGIATPLQIAEQELAYDVEVEEGE